VPIHGRILDIEGRPVSGATVRVVNLFGARDGNLDIWEREAKRSGASYWSLRQYLRFMTFSQKFQEARPPVLPAVTTNADGWFTLKGVGRERMANLIVTGPSIETTSIDVRSRRGEVIKLKKDPGMSVMTPKSGLGPDDVVYPCEFTCVAGPSVPISGRVVDADSQHPLAGVVELCLSNTCWRRPTRRADTGWKDCRSARATWASCRLTDRGICTRDSR
jgi:hypothetical protein